MRVTKNNVCGESVLSRSNRKSVQHPAAFVAIFALLTACGSSGINEMNSKGG